jgi:hypothetical protein
MQKIEQNTWNGEKKYKNDKIGCKTCEKMQENRKKVQKTSEKMRGATARKKR